MKPISYRRDWRRIGGALRKCSIPERTIENMPGIPQLSVALNDAIDIVKVDMSIQIRLELCLEID